MRTTPHLSFLAALAVLAAAGRAHATGGDGTGGNTVRLDSRVQLWVSGDDRGPATVGKNTGAGIMDATFAFDTTAGAKAAYGSEVLLGTAYTRSANTPNGNNSFMQGGFALAKLTGQGVQIGKVIDLPALNGERAYMRPLVAFSSKFVLLLAASEDNDSNNGNPKPVLFLADKATGALVAIPNNPRGIGKPIDLVSVAQQGGVQVDNPDNQRGPHMIVPVTDDSFLVGMQYNNQAQEAFRFSVGADGRVAVSWLQRYSDNAVHNRPQVAYTPGAPEAYLTAVECNAQPANIGIRLTKLDIATGKPIASQIVVKADPNQNRYVSEPHIADLGDKVGLVYGITAKARNRNGNDGHAGGANVSNAQLFRKADLSPVGAPLVAPANYQRHPGAFAMHYGPDAKPALGVISGSSTGTAKGLLQVIPVKDDGTLDAKDALKVYTVSTYSDVANLQARGKRNPNNQAKGFINGIGDVPNPGFDKAGGFYPEVKTFSFSTVTGYSSPEAAAKGLKESLWLSLVPATWKQGLETVPGGVSENAGDQPAARTDAPVENAGKKATAKVPLGMTDSGGCTMASAPREGGGALYAAIATTALLLGALARRRTRHGASASLATAACAAALVAACSDSTPTLSPSGSSTKGDSDDTEETSPSAPANDTPAGTAATGKAYFTSTVHPMLAQKCGGCHDVGGIGTPSWMMKADPERTYDLVYANGWVTVSGSHLVEKGPHASGSAPALADAEKTMVLAWVAMEVKDGAVQATSGVLDKLGSCLDPQAFAAIGFEKLVTTRRTAQNNTNNVTPWNETANTCTGCDNTPCRACHSLDDATGFVMAVGNPNLPATITFEETKKVVPAYLQKYVTTGPDGKPAASNGLARKSDATKKAAAYTHPMFVIPPDMQTRIDAFVADALAKWTAGTCGK